MSATISNKKYYCEAEIQHVVPMADELSYIPAQEVNPKNGQSGESLWLVIDEIVYDCTSLVDQHPGGKAVLESFAGKDCSCEYMRCIQAEHVCMLI